MKNLTTLMAATALTAATALPAAAEMLKVTLFRDWLLEEAALAEETRPALPN